MALEYSEKIPEQVPGSLPVYRLVEPDPYPASSAALAKVAGRIGLEGRAHETRTSDEWTMHHEGPFELGHHRESGAVVGRHRERYLRHDERAFELKDEESQSIAERFLERSELIPGDSRLLRVTHLRTAGRALDGGEVQEHALDAGVVFGRTLERTPVDGPGGFAMVHIDPEGEVSGFRVVWRPVAETIGEVGIRPPDEASRALEGLAKRVKGDVRVTKSTFGYFEQGISERQRFLQPAYAMVYVIQDEEVAIKSAYVVPAGEKVFEPLMGEKRFPIPPQPPRSGAEPRKDRIG
jgi:hypothetical protein